MAFRESKHYADGPVLFEYLKFFFIFYFVGGRFAYDNETMLEVSGFQIIFEMFFFNLQARTTSFRLYKVD